MPPGEYPSLASAGSSYRRVGRKAGLCTLNCNDCHCEKHVMCALRDRLEKPEQLLGPAPLSPDIFKLIHEVAAQGTEIVGSPDQCEHTHIIKVAPPVLRAGSDDEL